MAQVYVDDEAKELLRMLAEEKNRTQAAEVKVLVTEEAKKKRKDRK